MRIAITGATGFLGAHLTRALLAKGHDVVALVRSVDHGKQVLGSEVQLASWPSTDEPIAEGALADVDTVIHLAGESVTGRWNQAKRERILKSRVNGTRRLVEAIAHESPRPRKLLSSSAIGVYGDRGDEALTEDAEAGDLFLSQVCCAWEAEALKARDLGVSVALLRTGLVLGLDGGPLKEMLPIFRKGLGGRLGSGKQVWSWIHLADWLASVSFLLNSQVEGPVNVTAPAPVDQKTFAKTLAKTLGRPAFLATPAFVLRTVLGGFSAEILTGKRVIPQRLMDAGFRFEYPKLGPALEALLNR